MDGRFVQRVERISLFLSFTRTSLEQIAFVISAKSVELRRSGATLGLMGAKRHNSATSGAKKAKRRTKLLIIAIAKPKGADKSVGKRLTAIVLERLAASDLIPSQNSLSFAKDMTFGA